MKILYFLTAALFLFNTTNAQIVNIPDVNFKAKLLASLPNNQIASSLTGNYFKIDANSNNEIEVSEALQVGTLNVQASSISSLSGIEYFANLKRLDCKTNQLTDINVNGLIHLEQLFCNTNQLTSINVSALTSLVQFTCAYNQLPVLNISTLTGLTFLDCRGNQLTNLNLTGLSNITELWCGGNQLPDLNLAGLTNLLHLYCDYNQLSVLNVSSLTTLTELNCNNNQISVIDVSTLTNLLVLSCRNNLMPNLNVNALTNLQRLDCYNNQLTNIDVSGLNNMGYFNCGMNQLTTVNVNSLLNLQQINCSNNNLLESLFVKNGVNENYFIFSGCPNLEYICADDVQITAIQTQITTYGYINCYVNNYCSFSPGGTFYTIQGNNRYDSNNNGCDVGDIAFPNLKFTFSDGTNTGNLIADATGNYHYDAQAGTQTMTPILESPSYFNISPVATVVSFPTASSQFLQDFCISANGVHNDLEVSILPITVVRPGLNTTYKIFYKNKGTQSESGTISFAFNDAVLDFVNANPAVTSQAINYLNWNFTDLLPFETREVTVTLNVNSPTEVPPVVGGDILNYTASVNSSLIDETPNDNMFVLNQTVVNSFDPNDKICLEGNTITPEMVGKEVHYMIRFENTGTTNAENIVVKDMIDTNKFDINSLIPIASSHSFVTRINETNKVEFIFENINLPFDDANNDGYVMFKIKTKPSLVLGNTFSNTASIYFDYNFPIVTDPVVTTVALLANSDFVFENYFKIYPNPTYNTLNIEAKTTIGVKSISIYNTLGQLVLVIPNAQQTKSVDVSSLETGNYFIKINTDKGSSNDRFIKM